MRTSKFISTISYNSVDYLVNTLNGLLTDNKVSFWLFIEHFPESGERKKHKHVLILPNGICDTDRIRNVFAEIVPDNDIPLSVMPFRTSKFVDAYLYFLHDKNYLLSKGLEKKYHYDFENIITSDRDFLTDLIGSSDFSKFNKISVLLDAIENNISFELLVASGRIPVTQIRNYERAYELLTVNSRLESIRAYSNKEIINGEQIHFKEPILFDK